MADSDFATALPDDAAVDKMGLREALIQRVVYALADSEDPEAYTAVDSVTGAQPIGLAYLGLIFWLDATDMTTAHDGTTTIVTADGWRYKRTGLEFIPRSVIGGEDTPPDPNASPPDELAIGDAYLVDSGATGDWAGHAHEIAIWTPRLEWAFVLPQVGMLLFVESDDGFYHYSVDGAWVAGVGQSALSDETVKVSHIQGQGGRVAWVVVNQTTNTPPGGSPGPAVGVAYIVGSAPTGDWAGHSGKIATWEGSEWGIYQPANGWQAYDEAQNSGFRFDGSDWVSQAGAIVAVDHVFTESGSTTGIGGSSYSYSSGTAPTTGAEGTRDDATLTHTARGAGAVLEFLYEAREARNGGTTSASAAQTLGLFRDSEANAIAWCKVASDSANALHGGSQGEFSFGSLWPMPIVANFRVTAPDSSSHTYHVRALCNSTDDDFRADLGSRRLFEVRERAL